MLDILTSLTESLMLELIHLIEITNHTLVFIIISTYQQQDASC